MTIIYLSLSTQVAKSTFFMKSPVSTAQVGNMLLNKILSSKNHVLFFAENWNLKAETVSQVREKKVLLLMAGPLRPDPLPSPPPPSLMAVET